MLRLQTSDSWDAEVTITNIQSSSTADRYWPLWPDKTLVKEGFVREEVCGLNPYAPLDSPKKHTGSDRTLLLKD